LAQGVPIRGDRGEIAGWAGINLDISRLKLTEEALRETDRRKDEFLATLAHELRNPLAPIRHAVRLLESATLEARQARWAREVIARQVQRMALLLDDLLDVSRITRGRLALKVATVSLESVVGAAVETARPLIDSKQQRLTIDLPDRPLDLAVDPLRISQALSNLLTNAAKYTDAGGSIALRATVTAEAVLLCVQDTGIGFEPGMLPGMFDMFSQVDSAIDRAEGGLGIGLSLVKGLMELHGGSVEAVSAGPGSGSEFTLRLPRSVLVPTILPTTSAAAGARTNAPCRVKVLIADDNRDAADSLAMLLQMSGYEVFARHGGADALTLAAAVLPHAMILDIGMPEMTGYEVAREVRTAPWGSEVLLVAVTGWGQKDDKVRAAEAGFDHHLTKPVDPDQIEQLLHARFGAPASASEPV
jgi:CheY-like chemotaxis protein